MHSQGILISCEMQKLFREQKSVLPFLCKCLSLESNYAPIFSFLWQVDLELLFRHLSKGDVNNNCHCLKEVNSWWLRENLNPF